jgi:hypothetical protein
VRALTIRPDLLAAQHAAWREVTAPGASWSGAQRAAIAATALAALDDPDPLPPWVAPSGVGRELPGAGELTDDARDAIYRIARHAGTLTEDWYRAVLAAGTDPVAYVELIGVVAAAAAVDGFYRAIGMDRPPLPETVDGPPHRRHPPVEPATLNWVLVAAPADVEASVVQGLSAAPADFEDVKRLAAAQYIPFDEMGELAWSRGTLSRSEMELIAARLSALRQCFF